MPAHDPDVHDVYDAEDRLDRWSDLGVVTVFGSAWVLEPEVRFGRVEDVQAYVDRVLAHVGHPQPARVRRRRGATRAHYEQGGVIALPGPEVGGRWALRENTVLHELAHHLVGGGGHGVEFRRAYVRLQRDTGHPSAAALVTAAYAEAGLAF
ncbi:TIGR04338 family metallohydrolase [Agilicoccus flavus]|uniref:TIGR04338 family metallohydrolase n=1 Tax=Agilicoccus flavus TaxID=2775968 RepID=UPI001CF6F4CB|nr:TIGR04338 family metallohydrolase [Agilicoccus flavus]